MSTSHRRPRTTQLVCLRSSTSLRGPGWTSLGHCRWSVTWSVSKCSTRSVKHSPTRPRDAAVRVPGPVSRGTARPVRGAVWRSRRGCLRGGTCKEVQMTRQYVTRVKERIGNELYWHDWERDPRAVIHACEWVLLKNSALLALCRYLPNLVSIMQSIFRSRNSSATRLDRCSSPRGRYFCAGRGEYSCLHYAASYLTTLYTPSPIYAYEYINVLVYTHQFEGRCVFASSEVKQLFRREWDLVRIGHGMRGHYYDTYRCIR